MSNGSFEQAFGEIGLALGSSDAVLILPIGLIDEDPSNPRTRFDDGELSALAETIARKGLLQPLTVRPPGPDGRYLLRFGARRLRAARLAGLADVRAIVQSDELDAAEAIVEQLIENDQREGLSTAEWAQAVSRLLDLGVKQAEIGRRLGRPKDQIAMLASVRDMPAELRAMASSLGARTLYELFGAWKADQDRTKVWLSGREPASITQAAARELAGRPAATRRLVRDPSDGTVREEGARPAGEKEGRAEEGTRDHSVSSDPPPSGTAVFEVKARGVKGTLVLDNVVSPSLGVRVRRSDGSLVQVPATDIKIVRVRPG